MKRLNAARRCNRPLHRTKMHAVGPYWSRTSDVERTKSISDTLCCPAMHPVPLRNHTLHLRSNKPNLSSSLHHVVHKWSGTPMLLIVYCEQ